MRRRTEAETSGGTRSGTEESPAGGDAGGAEFKPGTPVTRQNAASTPVAGTDEAVAWPRIGAGLDEFVEHIARTCRALAGRATVTPAQADAWLAAWRRALLGEA